ncbi:MAG: IS21 family transposase [Solirubrobacterales bacterium]|nr:IS21 family transposase [Solirubrobacterales bacterium]
MHRLQELVRLHRQGLPCRAISRLLRMGRNTVASYTDALRKAELLDGGRDDLPDLSLLREAIERERGLPKLPRQQQSSIERWLPIIDAKYADNVPPTAIYDFLRLEHDDFAGSLSAVKRRCAALKRARGISPEDVTMPVETDPGDVAQVDFGYVGNLYDPASGKEKKAWVFVMTLGFSRHMVARIVFDQKVETWLRLHIQCFEELGGVPKTLVPDNLKAAVVRAAFGVDDETALNRSYCELARHYGFVVDPTPPRSPEKKGKVESSVRYIKHNYFKGHAPQDVRDARTGLQRWLVDIAGQRRHGTTGRRPAEVFAQAEKPLLSALPRERMELVAWQRAKLHRDCHAVFRGEFYSAPWHLVGKQLELRVTRHAVTVYHEDEHICTHDRVSRGKRATIESHLPDQRSALRHRSREHWESLAYAIGKPTGDYVAMIFDSDDVLHKLRQVQAVVTHLQGFPENRANAACVRALHYGNHSYQGIKDILRRGLDLHPIPGGGNRLADHWSTRPRFSRVPSRATDDHDPRPDQCPEEAPSLRRVADDGAPRAAGS